MAGEGSGSDRAAATGLGSVADAFQNDVLRPLMAASAQDPDAARSVMSAIRSRLDQLDALLQPIGTTAGTTAGTGDFVVIDRGSGGPVDSSTELFEIGRNQRAQYREMILLELMATEARPFSIAQLMKGLDAKGFHDGQPAVVSQLHRMKGAELISQPGNGMYMVTRDGLGQLQRLRSSVGALRRS